MNVFDSLAKRKVNTSALYVRDRCHATYSINGVETVNSILMNQSNQSKPELFTFLS